PFMMRWPGHLAVGATDDRLAGLVDITPTALAAAGVAPTDGPPLDGRSLLDPAARTEALLEYAEDPGFEYPPWASLRGPAWQYLEYYGDDAATVEYAEYYDLAADPYQLTNVLADADSANDPDVAALSARLAQARQCSGANCP
ncbi:MAG: sulfatase/phosphatase domain-containing protein, partial [Acidimicrobiia bacterium]